MNIARDSGLALIMVLMILSLVAGLTLTLTAITSEATTDTRSWQTNTSLYYATLSGEAYGMALLQQDFDEPEQDLFLNEPRSLLKVVPQGTATSLLEASVIVEDLQAKFNLTVLAQGDSIGRFALDIFSRYAAELALPPYTQSRLLEAIEQFSWNRKTTSDFELKYSVLNRLLGDTHINLKTAAIIMKHFSALPPDTPININTAPQALVSALIPGTEKLSIQQYVNSTSRANNTHSPTTSTDPVISALSGNGLGITATSQYFSLNTNATLGKRSRSLRSLVSRDLSTGEVTLVFRSSPELSVQSK